MGCLKEALIKNIFKGLSVAVLLVFFIIVFSFNSLADIDWTNFPVFAGTTAPYAANGPGCKGWGGTGLAYGVGTNCPASNPAYDLGAVWVDLDSNYIAWQVYVMNLSNSGVCGGLNKTASSGANQWGVTIEFNADSNTSTGCRMPNSTFGGDMCYPGADYRFFVYGDNSTVFERYNISHVNCGVQSNSCFDTLRNGTIANLTYNVTFQAYCTGSNKLRIAVNRSAISNLVGMTFQTNTLGGGGIGPQDMLGGYDSTNGFVDNFMQTGTKDMMTETQHPCRTLNASTICNTTSTISNQNYSCTWDSFQNKCNPNFMSLGGAGMSCSDFCGACTTTTNCTSGNKGKCKTITKPTNLPPGISPLTDDTTKMCVENMNAFVSGSGSCDSECKYCYTATTCGNSTYPNPSGTGAGCQWVTDSQFGKSWCDFAAGIFNFTCGTANMNRCLNSSDCITAQGNWSTQYNFCFNESKEICFDGVDNNNDQLIDCVDSSCSKDSSCGGDIDLLTGGFGTLNSLDALKKFMFKNMDPSPPVQLATRTASGVRADVDITEFDLKDMGTALGLGIGVTSMSNSLLCNGLNSSVYFYLLDSDANTSTGCTTNISNNNVTGFEYKFEYLAANNGTNNLSEIRRAYRCFNNNFSLFPAKMSGAPVETVFGGQSINCMSNVAILAVDKSNIGNPKGRIRFMAAAASNVNSSYTTNVSLATANTSILGLNNAGIFFTPGTVDFRPKNCFENPMACGTAFSLIGGGKFMPFEECFPTTGDEDMDGSSNCADSDCMMAPWCAGTDYTTNDKTAPTVDTSKANPYNDFVFLQWTTNEPTNATITIHSSCSNSTAKNTIYDAGSPLFTFDDYRPYHGLDIRNNKVDSLGATVALSASNTYFYKLKTCDRAGNCGLSACLNFTTTAAASAVQYKFDSNFNVTSNSRINNTVMKIWNGTAYINVTVGATQNTSNYLNNATLVFDNPINNWTIQIEGVNLATTANINLTDAFNITNTTNTTYVGINNQRWLEMVQTLGASSVVVTIPDGKDSLMKCSESNLSDCSNVTAQATLIAGGMGYTNSTWRIPTSLGFSSYGGGGSSSSGSSSSSSGSSSSSSSSSSSGGGTLGSEGGISTGVTGQFEKKVWSLINAGETATIEVKKDGMTATKVEFKIIEKAAGAWVNVKRVEKSDMPSSTSSALSNAVYQYMEITKSSSLKDTAISEGKIEFKVEKSWLTQNKLDKNAVALFRYTDSKWNELKASILKEDDKLVYYSASTPGFSYFAVGQSSAEPAKEKAKEKPAVETKESTALKEEKNVSQEPIAPSKFNKKWLYWGLKLFLVLVAAAFIWLIIYHYRKKTNN